jgi:hypothetical protein
MALSAQQVIKTYDYYNTLTVVPGYSAIGYPDENNIAKAYYSTKFSSNPIGSQIDFFTHLNDPCIDIVAPQPVFTITKPLSALSPQWIDGWWDQAMFYSHPEVVAQLSANYPDIYQNFSDSVGTLAYGTNNTDYTNPNFGRDPIALPIQNKVISNVFKELDSLNNDLLKLYQNVTPKGFGLGSNNFLRQALTYQGASFSLQAGIETKYGVLKVKIPFATNLTGNLENNPNWNVDQITENINNTVDKINNAIKTPGRMLSEAIFNVKQYIKDKIKQLPSIGKLLGLNVGNPTAVTKVLQQLQSYASAAKSVLNTAEGVLAATKTVVATVQQGIGSIAGTLNTETNLLKNTVNTVQRLPATVQGFNSVVSVGGTTVGLNYQTNNAVTNLNSNKVTIIPGTVKSDGNPSVISINTVQNPPNT